MQKKGTRKRGQREEHGERGQRKSGGGRKRDIANPFLTITAWSLSPASCLCLPPHTTSPTHAHSHTDTDSERRAWSPRGFRRDCAFLVVFCRGLRLHLHLGSLFREKYTVYWVNLSLWFENTGIRPISSWYPLRKKRRKLRVPDGFFLSTFPSDTYLLNTYSIVDILKNQNTILP